MNKKVKSLLEKTKLVAETITAVIPIAKLVLVAAGVLGLVMVVRYNNQQDELDKYIAQYNEFKAQAKSASDFADSLQTQVIIAENDARAAQSRANEYKTQVVTLRTQTTDLKQQAVQLSETITDTVELARTLLPLKDSIITIQETTIGTQESQIYELEAALKNKDTAITLLTLSRDSLQTVVNNIPPAPKNPNRVFGIKLPSRKSSFIAGTIAGLILTTVVIK